MAGNGPEERYCTKLNIMYLLMFGLKGWSVLGVGFDRHTPQQQDQQQFQDLGEQVSRAFSKQNEILLRLTEFYHLCFLDIAFFSRWLSLSLLLFFFA